MTGAPATSSTPGADRLDAFFAGAWDATDAARDACGSITRRFVIAGLPVEMRFHGDALVEPLTRAFAHLAEPHDDRTPSLVLDLWDTASTGVAMPSPTWSVDDYIRRGEIRDFHDGTRYAAFSVGGAILNLYDAATGRGIYWTRDAAGVPYYEHGAPCRSHLGWWLTAHGRQAIHAGAVADASGCALLAGKGGSGKSNTALACLLDGLDYLSDDYCVVSHDPAPTAWSLYCTGKVQGSDLERLPELAACASNRARLADEKALCFLTPRYAARLRRSASICAVVLPHVMGRGTTSVRPARPSEAVLALAPSTTSQLPYAGAEVLRSIARITKDVPAFHLDIGLDFPAVAHAVRALLASLR